MPLCKSSFTSIIYNVTEDKFDVHTIEQRAMTSAGSEAFNAASLTHGDSEGGNVVYADSTSDSDDSSDSSSQQPIQLGPSLITILGGVLNASSADAPSYGIMEIDDETSQFSGIPCSSVSTINESQLSISTISALTGNADNVQNDYKSRVTFQNQTFPFFVVLNATKEFIFPVKFRKVSCLEKSIKYALIIKIRR